GCILNGKLYPLGEIDRTEGCFTCSCSQYIMSCCSLFHTPRNYDGKNCKVLFNKKTCNYDVVEKNDPSKICSHSRV
ncbi:MSMB protein, partial [Climacteris rufus]|nr:MSMB protein [Climacteris rufus]